MDADDIQGVIEMLETWKLTAKGNAEDIHKSDGLPKPKSGEMFSSKLCARFEGEATGLQMAINALSHFVEE